MKIGNVMTFLCLMALGVSVGFAQQTTTAKGYFKCGNGNVEYLQSAEAMPYYTKAVEIAPTVAE